jgi:hypothetical protein
VGIEEYPASEMTDLLNKLSQRNARTISIEKYRAMVFKALPAEEKRRCVMDRINNNYNGNKLLNMPPEFDISKMRFVWWDGDYARNAHS